MSSIHDFITELVRAANEVDRVSDFEARRLLGRAVTTIRDMREQIGITGLGTAKDAVIALQTTTIAIGLAKRKRAEIRTALLDAAAMIRDLHIVLDTRTEIQFGGNK